MVSSDDDYDTPWKTALTRYLPQFMAFYFPRAHAAIDWTRPHVFLDQELAQLARDAEQGRRRLDKLVQVHTHDGGAQWVLLHLEVQGRRERGFAERIFTYNYRLYDMYRRTVASLVLLADGSAHWRPRSFAYQLFGCRVGIDFPVVKLTDFADRIDGLLLDPNPFALVTAAHLLTRQTKGDAARRHAEKWRLARMLYQRDWDKQSIIDLYQIIDWLMRLPVGLEHQMRQDIMDLEGGHLMPYVSSIERLGREIGRQEGKSELLAQQLTKRFGPLAADVHERLQGASNAQLNKWAMRLLDAPTLDAVFRSAKR